MRILIFGINFFPELTGIGKYTGEMAFWLANRGHEVSVITTFPYYPEWKTQKQPTQKNWGKEVINGVNVYRCPIYVPENVTAVKRIIHEFTFELSSTPIWIKMLCSKKFDVVFCPMPPFHIGFYPLIYRFFKKSKVIFHIQDLQVDAAKDLNMINNQSLLSIMFKLEKYLLTKANIVSTISDGMMTKILNKGIQPEKTILFPNWVDSSIVYPLDKKDSLISQLGLSYEDKIILYSGNLGEKQGLDIIIPVAQKFKNDPHIKFVIVGSGGIKNDLLKQVNEQHLTDKVKFYPLQPIEKMSALLAIADVHLVLQKKSASDLVLPSKLTGILSAGGLAIVSAVPGTSLYKIVKDNEVGIIIEPESVDALSSGIEMALNQDNTQIRRNSKSFADKFLSMNGILTDFEHQLHKLLQIVN